MKLKIFNGSPRGKASNSEVIVQWMTNGMEREPGLDIEVLYLNKIMEHGAQVSTLQGADMALIVFPLYTDCMPGIVMEFIEKLEPLKGSLSGLKLGFAVHSGFPEATHSRAVEKYLEWLANDLGTQYLGTVVMGGSESLRHMSPTGAEDKRSLFSELGRGLVAEGQLSAELVKKAVGMERLPVLVALLLKVISKFKFFNAMWDNQLKKNNAYAGRSARPYVD